MRLRRKGIESERVTSAGERPTVAAWDGLSRVDDSVVVIRAPRAGDLLDHEAAQVA